jgi:oligopeptidase A
MQQRGVGLDGEHQIAFNQASERLAALSTSFGNHVLDATQQWTLKLTDPKQVQGLPKRALEALAAAARDSGDAEASAEEGPWLVGLDMPRYIPVLTHADDRSLRESVYRAHVSRASQGELDNAPLIEEILGLRREQAQRLGYAHWAELSLASKMADDVPAVEALLEELRAAAYPAAETELEQLKACASRQGAAEADALAPWDITYWSEKLRRERFDLDQEALRPWFPLPQVLDGLFGLCSRLFDVEITPGDGEAPVWHNDVRFFHVRRRGGEPIAAFYLDPYSRPASKRGGAWMDECLGRHRTSDGSLVLPVAYLICNQTPPVGEAPSLMSFEEVETLFHEFGHGLQHMLTTVDEPEAAGISNVEWDAVELPSQFMENWCLDQSTLMGMARHWQTGEPLPQDEVDKLRNSRTFNAGLATLRQVHFALTDLRLHSQWTPQLGLSPDELRRDIANTTTVMDPIPKIASFAPSGTSSRGDIPPATTPTNGPRCSVPMPMPPLRKWVSTRRIRFVPPGPASGTQCSASAAAALQLRCSRPSAVASPAAKHLSVIPACRRPDSASQILGELLQRMRTGNELLVGPHRQLRLRS